MEARTVIRRLCAACMRPAEGNYSLPIEDIKGDDWDGVEDDVPLCDACGGEATPTVAELVNSILAQEQVAHTRIAISYVHGWQISTVKLDPDMKLLRGFRNGRLADIKFETLVFNLAGEEWRGKRSTDQAEAMVFHHQLCGEVCEHIGADVRDIEHYILNGVKMTVQSIAEERFDREQVVELLHYTPEDFEL